MKIERAACLTDNIADINLILPIKGIQRRNKKPTLYQIRKQTSIKLSKDSSYICSHSASDTPQKQLITEAEQKEVIPIDNRKQIS